MKLIFIFLFFISFVKVFAGEYPTYEPSEVKTNLKENRFIIVYQDSSLPYTYSAEAWDADLKLISSVFFEHLYEVPYLDDFSGITKEKKAKFKKEVENFNKKAKTTIAQWKKTLGLDNLEMLKETLIPVKGLTKVDKNSKRHSYWWGFNLPTGFYPKKTQIILNMKIKNMDLSYGTSYVKVPGKKAKEYTSFFVVGVDGALLVEPIDLKIYYLKKTKQMLGVFSGWKGVFIFKAPAINKK